MIEFDFSPFPEIQTERLLLRRLTADDVEPIYRLRSNPETMKFVPRPLVKNHEEAMQHISLINDLIDKNEGINWAITLKGNPEFIGIIGFYRTQKENHRSELGYMLLPEFSGRGITSEAVNGALEYGFNQMKLHSVEAVIDPENYASERVLQKNGFVKEAHFLENEFYDGRFLDTVIYALLKRNYKTIHFPHERI
ncbi:MAG: alanine acetyltransferase [Flavobacterium sp. BFFFF1]|uniref:GNAT family N-acetyltransferase n=1 Tax=unclassified Flavobacterium TaxID=196869 RepID=UPI000BCB6B2B|nr:MULTISPECIES: GNAT family N-acetyltransferase [unclassified Flavobacterium]OYU80376.1 MAG: alanine acetyltransferase [Flavobacterium sp. BFFFF1]